MEVGEDQWLEKVVGLGVDSAKLGPRVGRGGGSFRRSGC